MQLPSHIETKNVHKAWARHFDLIMIIIAVLVLLIAFSVLFGWVFDIQFLKSISPRWSNMKPNTAICFILSGAILLLLRQNHVIVRAAPFIILLIGLLSLSENIFNWNLGIDELLFKDTLIVDTVSSPGRMSSITSLNFIFIALSFLLFKKKYFAAQVFAIISLIVSFLSLIGYYYGVNELTGFGAFTKMALYTSVCFLLVSIGILFSQIERGFAGLFLSNGSAGDMLRHLLPAAILLPLGLGWLTLLAKTRGWYYMEFGIALFSISIIILLVMAILWNARQLNKDEEKKVSANEMITAFKELAFVNEQKEKQASGLISFNEKLLFQNEEKEKRASELIIANKELGYQNQVKETREEELVTANNGLKESEKKLIHANRLYAFISQINQAITHSKDERTIFKKACQIAIEIGNFKISWIGLLDKANQKIDYVGGYGIRPEDISRFKNVTYQNDSPQYHVLGTGTSYVCNNIQDDPELHNWKAFATHMGLNSAMVIPIRKFGEIIGTFNLYASELDFFTASEIALLEEATGDISFAADLFEKDKLRTLAEQKLKENEIKLNHAQAIAHLGNWELDFSTGMAIWSEEALRIYGLPTDEIVQSYATWLSFIHPDDLEYVNQVTNHAKVTLTNANFFYRIVKRDGTIRHIHSQAHLYFKDSGKPVGLYGVIHDVTEIKEAEESRRESESNLQAIFENTSEGFILIDTKGVIKNFNKRARDIEFLNTGQEIETGKNILDLYDSKKHDYKDMISRILSGETINFDHSYARKNGEVKWFSWTKTPVYNEGIIDGICITSADITDRKEAEEMLRNSQLNLEAIIENTDASIYSLDSDFRYLTFNKLLHDNLEQIYGLDIKPGDNVYDFLEKLNPGEALEWEQVYSKALHGEVVKFEKEFSFDNIYSYFSFAIYPIWEKKTVIGLSCFAFDITKQKQDENAHRQTELRYRQIMETAQEGIWIIDENNLTIFVNKKMCDMLGYSREEMIGRTNLSFKSKDEQQNTLQRIERRKQGISENHETSFITKSGKNIWTYVSTNAIFDENGKYKGTMAMFSDITEKKTLEYHLAKSNQLARIGNWEIDLLKNTLYWSDVTKEIYEVSSDFNPDLETAINFYKAGSGRDAITAAIQETIEKNTPFDLELELVTFNANERWVRTIGTGEFINGKCIRLYGSIQDIDERKRSEIEILKVYEEKNAILESIGDAFFAVDKDSIVTYWNKKAEIVMAKSRDEVIGKNIWDVFNGLLDTVSYKYYQAAVKENKDQHYETFSEGLNKWLEVSAYPSKNGLTGYFRDITDRKLLDLQLSALNVNLTKHVNDLATSNKELEQFAYVASHDLQEPLRMVTSFLTQIEKKYGGILDEKGRQYIHFAVDGAKRMRQIILDLLEFSRVGQTEDKQEEVDLNELMDEILLLLRKKIEEKKAVITIGKLPLIKTLRSPLRQVFQNLVNNSLTYHKKDGLPEISIDVKDRENYWEFAVTDNGIGIDPEYFDKIFTIFQRLHNKDEYSGTGIGLAITKKIIKSRGGKIWVESEEGKGSTFYFTIAKQNA
ncbi:MAG: PAS domain S-box protein [Ferruginibacter sp.]